jgi:magnesium transporter
MKKREPLLSLLQGYIERDPATAAHMLETIDEAQAISVLKSLSPQLCAQVFPYLNVHYAATLLQDVPPSVFEAIVPKMTPEQAATILVNIKHEERKTLLDRLPVELKKQIQDLLTYPESSVGRIMLSDFLALHESVKVKDAIQKVRSVASRHAHASYTYVVDDKKCLIGVLNMRDLLLVSGETPIREIMIKDVFSIDGFKDREEAANGHSKRHFCPDVFGSVPPGVLIVPPAGGDGALLYNGRAVCFSYPSGG